MPVPDGGAHFLNDIVTGPDGTVYVTDTNAGRVWVARPGATVLQPFTAIGPLVSPNGITISTDGRTLFVADVDHVRGLDLALGDRIEQQLVLDVVGAAATGSRVAHCQLPSPGAVGLRIDARAAKTVPTLPGA